MGGVIKDVSEYVAHPIIVFFAFHAVVTGTHFKKHVGLRFQPVLKLSRFFLESLFKLVPIVDMDDVKTGAYILAVQAGCPQAIDDKNVVEGVMNAVEIKPLFTFARTIGEVIKAFKQMFIGPMLVIGQINEMFFPGNHNASKRGSNPRLRRG